MGCHAGAKGLSVLLLADEPPLPNAAVGMTGAGNGDDGAGCLSDTVGDARVGMPTPDSAVKTAGSELCAVSYLKDPAAPLW